MKKSLILLVLSILTSRIVSAQKTTFKGEAGYRVGFHGNVYESPVDYQKNDSVYYDREEMIESDYKEQRKLIT